MYFAKRFWELMDLAFKNLNSKEGIAADIEKIDGEAYKKAIDYLARWVPDTLYRYRAGTQNDIDSIQNDIIWMSAIDKFNDPFESRFFVDFDKIKKELKKTVHIKDFRGHDENPVNLYRGFFQLWNEIENSFNRNMERDRTSTFVSCFSEDNSSLLMWAHYANSHKGFCIGYDAQQLMKVFWMHLFPVMYCRDFYEIKTTDEYLELIGTVTKTMFRKSIEWSYEKEWRALLIDEKANGQAGILVNLFAPKEIFLGAMMEEKDKKEIIKICKKKKISVYQMEISKKSFQVEAKLMYEPYRDLCP